MKYKNEYKRTGNREEFVELLVKNGIRKNTAIRRFYDMRKLFGKQDNINTPILLHKQENVENDMIYKPSRTKLLMFEDMKRLNKKTTIEYLKRYGFTIEEINWLMKNDRMV
jgi:5'-3' exonuclease